MFNSTLLAKFILKRDRFQIGIWLIGLIGFTVGFVPIVTKMYGSDIERLIMGETMLNPAMVAMVGPVYGIDNYTIGAMYAHMMLLFMAIAVALMNIFFVVRHTRADEESGRIELIRSLPTGKLSTLVATLIVAVGINLILVVLTGIGLYAVGDESMNLNGSFLFGAVYGATGFVFASFTALFVQLSKNTRSVLSYAFTFLGISYLVRGIGDVSAEWLSRISPLGLVLRTQVYVNNYWWPIGVTAIIGIVVSAGALYLNSLRDLGDGFIAEKPGRKEASKFLQGYGGLTAKLTKTTVISWAAGMLILGISYGSVFGDLDAFFEGNEIFQQILPEGAALSMTEQFMAMLMVICAIIGAIPVITLVLRVKGEEKKNRLEQIFATPISREKVLGSYVISAMVASFLMISLSIAGLFLASSAVMEDPIPLRTMVEAGMAHLPAIWIMLSVTVFLVGVLPSFTSVTWLYLGYSFFAVYLGGLLQLPEWMIRLSPFGNVPQIPVDELSWTPLIMLTAIAIVFTIVGFIGYKKRDIQG